jgi:outer membrane putative beta-barrel porin/alpha-amylase
MKRRLVLAATIMFVPAMLAAQESSVATPKERSGGIILPTVIRDVNLPAPGTSAGQPTTTPRRLDRRRRGSMVGYIDDATVTSQVRVRFDAGFGNDVPDRAEFFYAKCGCYRFDPPPYFDADAPGPRPGVPTELRFQQLYIQADHAFGARFALFGELPIRAIQPQGFLPFGSPYDPFPSHSGLGDIRVGAKAALVSDDRRDVTFQVRASLPTGDAAEGLGTDNFSLEPGLLFHQSVTDRVALEAQFSTWFPFDGSKGVDSPDRFSGNVITYGVGPSFDLVRTDRIRFSPVVELVGWRVIGGFGTRCSADLTCVYEADNNIVNLKFGARTTLGERNSFYVGYGHALSDAVWYGDILRFEYRVNFGM